MGVSRFTWGLPGDGGPPTPMDAVNINFDNVPSSILSINVQDAVDEAFTDINVFPEDIATTAMADCILVTNPQIGDTVSISGEAGLDTYEFDGAGGNINVPIGANAAASRANLVNAINVQGSNNIFAWHDDGRTSVVINPSSSPGGVPKTGPGTGEVLSNVLTAAGEGWNSDTLIGGTNVRTGRLARGRFTVDDKMLGGIGYFWLYLPFQPIFVRFWAYDVNLTPKVTTACVFIYPTTLVGFGVGVGATPLAATDIVVWEAWEN